MKRFFTLAVLALAVSLLPGCYVARTLTLLFPDHKDYKRMPSATVAAQPDSPHYFDFHRPAVDPNLGERLKLRFGAGLEPMTDALDDETTMAFLIIRNDTLLYEHYFDKTTETTPVNTFSIAKGVIDALVGIAIHDGLIPNGIETPITDLVPEFRDVPGYDQIRVKHLLDMTSGLEVHWDFANPFGHLANTYYGRHLLRFMVKNVRPVKQPGVEFRYNNLNTQLLAFALERVTHKPVPQYLEEKLWQPMGMESPAYWMLDRPLEQGGTVKAFCCLNMVARDYARLGRLYLNNGNWNGQQLIPANWVQRGFVADTTEGRHWDYHNHWLIMDQDRGVYALRGLYDQDIVIYPDKNILLVLLNNKQNKEKPWFWESLFNQVFNQLEVGDATGTAQSK